MRIVISGSSGLIGTALKAHLRSQGHEVVALVRDEPSAGERRWDPPTGALDPADLVGAGAVINLNGAGIGDERWTPQRKQLILESRTQPTTLLAETMAAMEQPPPVFLSASAIGIYGDRGDAELTEDSELGGEGDYLATVTKAWEAAATATVAAGIRTVFLRTGIVLDQDDGALGRMLLPFKLGIGGRLGSGKQWWSWISVEDEVRAITHLLESELSGPVNLTAPHPVTNAEFTDALGNVLHRPTLLPVPKFALRTLLGGELAEALVFTSARVLPERLLADGFSFSHARVEEALRALFA